MNPIKSVSPSLLGVDVVHQFISLVHQWNQLLQQQLLSDLMSLSLLPFWNRDNTQVRWGESGIISLLHLFHALKLKHHQMSSVIFTLRSAHPTLTRNKLSCLFSGLMFWRLWPHSTPGAEHCKKGIHYVSAPVVSFWNLIKDLRIACAKCFLVAKTEVKNFL